MDLVAGDVRDIVLALSVDDMAAFDDPDRFVAHLPLGGGLDPTWLDLFSEAVRSVTGSEELEDFLDARSELEGAASVERIVDRVDPAWIEEVAAASRRRSWVRWPDAGSSCSRRSSGCSRARRSRGSGTSPGASSRSRRAATGARDVVFAWAF